jgi:methylphosphotriester-DNA--protein-cysteine methyltransferase
MSTTYVYITNSGKKYHRSGCRYLKKSKIKKTLKWAKAHGFKPCKVCKPTK